MSASSRFRTSGFPHSRYLQYSEHDWKYNNSHQYNLADGHCSRSESLVQETRRLCEETEQRTEKHKTRVERKYSERISDVEHWRTEGSKNMGRVQDALDRLAHLKTRLEKALEALRGPLLACQTALANRDRRLGVDLVQDKPQAELQKYQLYLEQARAVLEREIDQVEDQMIADRAAKQRLLRDVSDKQAALEIDTHASSCRPDNAASKGFKFDPSLMTSEKNVLTMADWSRSTTHNAENADREVKNSMGFLPRVEEILTRTQADLTTLRLRVVQALQDRLKELQEAQRQLEQRLSRVQKQALDVEGEIRRLEQAEERKHPALQLAAARLEGRRLRPRSELCRDQVDLEIEEEVRALSLSLHQLRDQKREAQEMLRRLDQARLGLQKDIEVKKNSILIDQEHCLDAFANVVHVKH